MRGNKVFYSLAALASIVYFYLVWLFTVNAPSGPDDFHAIQNFLVRFLQASGAAEKIQLFIEQHAQEHRVAFTKIAAFLVYAVSGKISYSADILVGCAILLGIAFFLHKMAGEEKANRGFAAFAIALLLFNGQSLAGSCWAMASLTNAGIVFLGFAAIYLMVEKNSKSASAAGSLISALTVFSNGNGMFVIPVVFICLCMQKRYKTCAAYLAVMALAVAAYFIDYKPSARTAVGLKTLASNIHVVFKHLCMVAGLNFWTHSFRAVSFIAGLSCLSVYFFGIWKKWHKKYMFCYACLTYLYLSIGALSVAWLNSEATFASYYRAYSAPILIMTVLLAAMNFPLAVGNSKRALLASMLLLGYYSFSAVYIHKAGKDKERLSLSAYRYHETGVYELADETDMRYLKEAERAGIYEMPESPLHRLASHVKAKPRDYPPRGDISYKIGKTTDKGDFVVIEGSAFITNRSMTLSDIYLCFGDYVCKTKSLYPECRTIPKESFFFAAIDKSQVKSGDYTIGILIKRMFDRSDYFIETTERVRF